MKLGIIGAGGVGSTLGRGLTKAGHTVCYGVRKPGDEKYAELKKEAAVATVKEAVSAAEATILATPWAAAEDALRTAGDFSGKPLLDATNPVERVGQAFALTHGHRDSGGEQVARWAPTARVAKVFNTTGRENMADPNYGDTRATMFICGDDQESCELARTLADDLGFETIVVGGMEKARVLEPMMLLWVSLAGVLGSRDIAFKLLQR